MLKDIVYTEFCIARSDKLKPTFSKDEKLVLSIVAIFLLAGTMVTTFSNVYLLNYTNSLIIISIYSMIRFSVLGFFAFISAKLSTKIRMTYSLVIGLALITSAVVFLLQAADSIATYTWIVYVVGLIWGAGEGFFWISINSLTQLVTSSETRSKYLGLSGAINSLMTIISPVLSSVILAFHVVETDGYFMMFQVAIVIFIFISILSIFVSKAGTQSSFSMKNSIKDFKEDLSWRYVVVAQFIWGVRDAATITLTGLLIYEAVGSGAVFARWLSFFALLSTISFYVIGRLLKHHNRIHFLTVGSIALFLSGLALILFQNVFGAIAHGILHFTFLPLAMTPFSLIALNVIGKYIPTENIMRRTVVREFMVALGRGAGLLLVVILATSIDGVIGLYIALFILYLFCLLFAYVTIKFNKKTELA